MILIFHFFSRSWRRKWNCSTIENRGNKTSRNIDQFKHFASWYNGSDKFLSPIWIQDVNQSFEYTQKFISIIHGWFKNGFWHFHIFDEFGAILCLKRTQYSWRFNSQLRQGLGIIKNEFNIRFVWFFFSMFILK